VVALQRSEYAAVALALGLILWLLFPGWTVFLTALAAPDLAILGYALGPVLGARIYNAVHVLTGPALLFVIGVWIGWLPARDIALIWALHIAIDRALGFGLKLPAGFRHTHLS
jgi:hypothetical protein